MDEALQAIIGKLLELPDEVLMQVIEEIAKSKDIDLSDLEDEIKAEWEEGGEWTEPLENTEGGEPVTWNPTWDQTSFNPADMFL